MAEFFLLVHWWCIGGPTSDFDHIFETLADCLTDNLDQKSTLCECLPALPIYPCLILVIAFVVTDDVVTVWVSFEEGLVSCLLGTLLLLWHDVVRIKHSFKLGFLVETELLFTRLVCLLRAHFDDSLSEFVQLEVDLVARFFDLVDCSIGTESKKHVHHFSPQVISKHRLDTLLAFLL